MNPMVSPPGASRGRPRTWANMPGVEFGAPANPSALSANGAPMPALTPPADGKINMPTSLQPPANPAAPGEWLRELPDWLKQMIAYVAQVAAQGGGPQGGGPQGQGPGGQGGPGRVPAPPGQGMPGMPGLPGGMGGMGGPMQPPQGPWGRPQMQPPMQTGGQQLPMPGQGQGLPRRMWR